MNDIVRNRIERQLTEMELLMSMYTNKGELEFDDASELADLRAALTSDNATVHVGGLGFTLHLTVMQVLLDITLYLVRYIDKEEIYVGGISATKTCRNLLGWRKTLLKPTEWCTVCEKYITTNWSDLRIFMKINQMHSIIHKLPKT